MDWIWFGMGWNGGEGPWFPNPIAIEKPLCPTAMVLKMKVVESKTGSKRRHGLGGTVKLMNGR